MNRKIQKFIRNKVSVLRKIFSTFVLVTIGMASAGSSLPAAAMGLSSSLSAVDTFPGFNITLDGNNKFSDTVDTTSATSDTGGIADPEPIVLNDCDSDKGAASVWYHYKNTISGISLSVDTISSSYDTVLAVWTGSAGSLNLIACNDDISLSELQSKVGFYAQKDVDYFIEVIEFTQPAPQALAETRTLNLHVEEGNFGIIGVTIGSDLMGTYTLENGNGQVLKYNVDGGPVEITGTPGSKIIASLSQWRARPDVPKVWTGVAQFMALPADKLSNIYVIPRYDYTDPARLYNTIVVSNLDAVDHDFTVTIEGVEMDGSPFTVLASSDTVLKFPGVSGGPVVVSSDPGANIIASLYELRRDPTLTGWNGQSEMMGIPWEELSDSYVIPRYYGAVNPNTLDARIFIANPDSVERSITVKIGGVEMDGSPYTLQPNTGQVLKYNVDGGPVEITGPSGSKIIASLSQWRARPNVPKVWTGVAQFMALPTAKLSNIYVISRYDYTDPARLYNTIVVSNLDAVDHDFTVTIEGVEMDGSPFTVLASSDTVLKFPGVSGGPVVVSSDPGANIIASLYELRRDPRLTGWNGQSEMLGIPWEELSDSYVIPRYYGAVNPATLDARIFIAVP